MANQSYTDQSIASLSAGQAGGTTPVLAANRSRAGIVFSNPSENDMAIGISTISGLDEGMPLPAGETIALGQGAPVPTNAFYVFGTATDRLTIWEA